MPTAQEIQQKFWKALKSDMTMMIGLDGVEDAQVRAFAAAGGERQAGEQHGAGGHPEQPGQRAIHGWRVVSGERSRDCQIRAGSTPRARLGWLRDAAPAEAARG